MLILPSAEFVAADDDLYSNSVTPSADLSGSAIDAFNLSTEDGVLLVLVLVLVVLSLVLDVVVVVVGIVVVVVVGGGGGGGGGVELVFPIFRSNGCGLSKSSGAILLLIVSLLSSA